MPLYTFRCVKCDAVFETLVRSDDTPACSACGATELERQIGTVAPEAKMPGVLGKVRAQAAREGHFSNYSKSELRRR
ncbi:FmdB family transcriptional regulator [Paramagnetospirillum marisnigri]|uniref:FmdB family transcriptional regulator n=1 Tax=Paramagnetospirillum marisnigri TaxID=1285242 RepID=A0A178MPR1_9PROT|nr:zinc ribbon domain-containing protein [Paramagnetospirillum marisnigri]OAN49934.1 FmdB family transcriptional regulator [Paramagnetospirillum marisnigri]